LLAAGVLGMGCSSITGRESFSERLPKRPNIIFILIDDLGWRDLTCYGSTFYETPNIDRMAKMGMLFTDAYSAAPLCSATRSSILTGKYPGRLHITGAFTRHSQNIPREEALKNLSARPELKLVPSPQTPDHLSLEETTFAEALKASGYATGFLGKWHVGADPYCPSNQGFGTVFGGTWQPNCPSYFYPFKIPTITTGEQHEYVTDRMTTKNQGKQAELSDSAGHTES